MVSRESVGLLSDSKLITFIPVTIYERRDFAGEVGASISCAASQSTLSKTGGVDADLELCTDGGQWLAEWGVDISAGKPVDLKKLVSASQLPPAFAALTPRSARADHARLEDWRRDVHLRPFGLQGALGSGVLQYAMGRTRSVKVAGS